jgi:hypothetical protein
MNKYKLIEYYPTLPKNWVEGMEVGQGDRTDGTYSPTDSQYEPSGRILLGKEEVEDNPKFWEKVTPTKIIKDTFSNSYYLRTSTGHWKHSTKEGKVLSNIDYTIKDSSIGEGRYIIVKSTKQDDSKEGGYEITQFKSCNGDIFPIEEKPSFNAKDYISRIKGEIYSVVRLVDKVTFTLGDLTKSKYWGKHTKSSPIERFLIRGNALKVVIDSDELSLASLMPPKDPLFITEDGVKIRENKNGIFQYWSLKLDNWKISNAPHILDSSNIIPTTAEDLLRCCNELRFSTRESAEEYILMNVKKLSIKDLLELNTSSSDDYLHIEMRKVRDRVKKLLKI